MTRSFFRVDLMFVIMKLFLDELKTELDGETTEENFLIMHDLAKDFCNEEILDFLVDIEKRNLKETFFRPKQ